MTDDQDNIETEALEDIALQMLSKDSDIREDAIDRLVEIAFEQEIDEDVMGPVLDNLAGVDLAVQRDIIRKLPNLLAYATAPLIQLLANPVVEVRDAAGDALREIVPGPYDLEEIARLLHHSNRDVRFSAAEFLQAEGQEDLIPDDVDL